MDVFFNMRIPFPRDRSVRSRGGQGSMIAMALCCSGPAGCQLTTSSGGLLVSVFHSGDLAGLGGGLSVCTATDILAMASTCCQLSGHTRASTAPPPPPHSATTSLSVAIPPTPATVQLLSTSLRSSITGSRSQDAYDRLSLRNGWFLPPDGITPPQLAVAPAARYTPAVQKSNKISGKTYY